ncbi:MAG: hypothetical protein KF724_11810 [Phycisphaeraceae bacterium]|nr:hypothetical protein [Phycisphaeraceae bacterium]
MPSSNEDADSSSAEGSHESGCHHAAMTACTLQIHYSDRATSEQRTRGGWWTCTVQLASVRTEALFDPSKSWVKADLKSDALLAHEQIHFDLVHIQARRAAARISRELGAKAFTAEAATEREARDLARARWIEEIERLVAEERAELNERNRLYDAETEHGTRAVEQQRWARLVERELRELGIRRPAAR